jgi:hypothetical protein
VSHKTNGTLEPNFCQVNNRVSGNRVNQDLATISEWPTNCTHTFIRSQSENAKLSH